MATPETAPSNINRLQELFMQRQLPLPQYEFGSSGPMHMPKFTAQVRIVVGSGAEDMYVIPATAAYSKKTDAKSAAAYAALLELSRRGWVAHPDTLSAPQGFGMLPGYGGFQSAPPPRAPHAGGMAMGWQPSPRPDTHFNPSLGAAYLSSPPAMGAPPQAYGADYGRPDPTGYAPLPRPPPPAAAAAPFVPSARPQPSLEALERVVLVDLSDVRAAVAADYAPLPGDFVVAFSAAAEDPAVTLGTPLPASVVRAAPGSAAGATEVMLLAWIYKFLERHSPALANAMAARGGGGGPPSLPIYVVSPGAASTPSSPGSSGAGRLEVAASVLECDVDYDRLGLRVLVVPSTRFIPAPSPQWPPPQEQQLHRTHQAPPGPPGH